MIKEKKRLPLSAECNDHSREPECGRQNRALESCPLATAPPPIKVNFLKTTTEFQQQFHDLMIYAVQIEDEAGVEMGVYPVKSPGAGL